MEKMIGYIFGSLHASESAIKKIGKTLRNQARINRRVTAFALVASIYAVLMELNFLDQEKRIEQLRKEIKELRHSEGE